MTGIFEGIRVLDLTSAVSGPTLTRLMAEMGADVIKVELPPTGELGRTVPVMRNGRSGFFVQQNRGKRSLFLDVKAPEGREVVEALVRQADVFVENFSPGVIARLGLDWETVSRLNPRLIMCSISAFGQEGPLRDQPGYDAIAQAYSGVMSMIGDPDGTPALVGLSPGDVLTGAHGLAGVSAALVPPGADRAGPEGRGLARRLLHDVSRDQRRGVVGVGGELPAGALRLAAPARARVRHLRHRATAT